MNINLRHARLPAVAFFAGLFTQITLKMVGNLPLGEVVLLSFCVAMVMHACFTHRITAPLLREPLFFILLAAQAVAFGSYVVTDLWRETSTGDILRGWSRMMFLGIDVIAMALLFGARASCFIWSQLGFALGGILLMTLEGAHFDAWWKFGYGGPATIAVFLICSRLNRIAGIVLIVALAVAHLALDFSSMGGICLLAAMLLCVQGIPRRFRALLLIPALAAGTALTFWLNSQQRGDDDGRGDRSTVERTAMMVAAWEGFTESPLIGQGSWFSKSRVMENFQLLRSVGARLAGVHGYAVETEETNIAIHSQLLVSVAEGGIFGGTFFIVFGAMLAWALWHCTISRSPDALTPIRIFFLLNATWNLFLSPFSGSHRIGIAFACALILQLWRESRQQPEADDESISNKEECSILQTVHS